LRGRIIHQLPFSDVKVWPIVNPAKFFDLIGQQASSAIINPLRTA